MPVVRSDMGNILVKELGFQGLDELQRRLTAFVANMSSSVMRDAMMAGGQVFRNAIQAATPVGSNVYTYVRDGKRVLVRHKTVGQAKANVIVYERKSVKGKLGFYTGAQAVASGLIPESQMPQPAFLVGYGKEHAYYMYWYEYGAVHARKQMTKVRYTTKTGKLRWRSKNVITDYTIQKKRPFIRAVFDSVKEEAFRAAAEVCRSRLTEVA